MVLVIPAARHLPDYVAALQRGWSPDNLRPDAGAEQLAAIARDADGFLARMEDREAAGGPVTLPDGSTAPRLPSVRRWIWRDGFCGSIGLRWRPGTEELPPHCLGHIGYAVTPWRRREGLATAALLALSPEARAVGLRHVDLTTDPNNVASIRVIEKAGGVFVKTFEAPAYLGGAEERLYRIHL